MEPVNDPPVLNGLFVRLAADRGYPENSGAKVGGAVAKLLEKFPLEAAWVKGE